MAETHAQVLQRWRDLRGMLIRQLGMFEDGALTLRSDERDLAPAAVADLKRSILEFDALLSQDVQADTAAESHQIPPRIAISRA